jgi:hypothetical protein
LIKHSIEIDRRPEDVFAYLEELDRHGEWQSATKRKVPGGPQTMSGV